MAIAAPSQIQGLNMAAPFFFPSIPNVPYYRSADGRYWTPTGGGQFATMDNPGGIAFLNAEQQFRELQAQPVQTPPPPAPPPPEVTAPFQQSPLAPSVVPPAIGTGAGVPMPTNGPVPVQNPIPPELAPPVFNVVPPAPAPIANVLPPELAPLPPPPLPPVTASPLAPPAQLPPEFAPPQLTAIPPVTNITPADMGAPPPVPATAPSVNAPPPKQILPPPPPEPPVTGFAADPVARLLDMQAQATPNMGSPLAPPGLANEQGAPPPSTPLIHNLDTGIPSPLAPMTNVPATAPSVPGQITPAPTQTVQETVGGTVPQGGAVTPTAAPVGEEGIPGTMTGTQAPGITPAAGGPSSAQAPGLAPPGEMEGPRPIPFNPNTPSPAAPNFGSGMSIEDFLGDMSRFQFGPEGILGVPGGPSRKSGQTEADFLRSLLNQGLFGGAGL